MSVTIRMQRAGGRNAPFYRVVVSDSRRARDGRFLEKVGYYNPLSQPAQVHLDQERIRFWVGNGAQLSESVNALWKKVGGKLDASAATPVATSVATSVAPRAATPVPMPVVTPVETPVVTTVEALADAPAEMPADTGDPTTA